ncbi:MAG: thiamine pyrophosphate-binding protein, partial [Gemmatimonadota bacterium]
DEDCAVSLPLESSFPCFHTTMPNPPEGSVPLTWDAEILAALLAEIGVSHVVTLPDNTSAPLLEAISLRADLRLLLGTREGEVISLAAGLWLGGCSPMVIIQNTGLLEAGDSLRGTASRMGAPLLMFVTCRGYEKSRTLGREPGDVEVTRDLLVRSDLDSVAHMTESTLRAWGIPFLFLRDPADLDTVRDAWKRAHEEERPVALLLDTSFTQGPRDHGLG